MMHCKGTQLILPSVVFFHLAQEKEKCLLLWNAARIYTSVFVFSSFLPFPVGFELLYQPEVVRLYLSLLTESQNYNTLEAAAGALQNLSAGQWTVSTHTHTRVTYFV